MNEIQGWSAIDTLYEIKGFELTARIFGYLFPAVVGIVLGFGLVHVLYKTSDDGRYGAVVRYLALGLVLAWLVSPTEARIALPAGYAYNVTLKDLVATARTTGAAHHSVKAPRIMVWSHALIDWLMRILVRSVDDTFEKQPFGHDRAAVLLRLAKIHDSGLRGRYQGFIIWCYVPAMAGREKKGLPPPLPYYDPFKIQPSEYSRYFIPGTDGDIDSTGYSGGGSGGTPDVPCGSLSTELSQKLIEHVKQAPQLDDARTVVRDLLVREGSLSAESGGGHSDPLDVVLRYVIYNETIGLLAAEEVRALQRAMPDYEMFDRKTQTDSNAQPGDWIGHSRSVVSSLIKIVQSVDQWIKHRAEGPAIYFKVTSYGPFVYGIASMILLGIFPFAAAVCLFPGHWGVLLTWAKYVTWIKLWMVFWAILSRFNEWRYSLDDIGSDASNGIGDQTYIFPAIAVMYLLTPGLSLIVVQLMAAAGKQVGGAIGHFVGNGGSAGMSPWSKIQDAAESLAGDGGEDRPPQSIDIDITLGPEPATPVAQDGGEMGGGSVLGEGGGAGGGGGGAPAEPPPVPPPA